MKPLVVLFIDMIAKNIGIFNKQEGMNFFTLTYIGNVNFCG